MGTNRVNMRYALLKKGLLVVLTIALLETSAAWGADFSAARFGGQTLILVVSDAMMGKASEWAQELPLKARLSYYRYDQIITLTGRQATNGELREAAIKAYQSSNVVDVMVFAHGLSGEFVFINSSHGPSKSLRGYSVKDLARNLAPLRGKFRLFYTPACYINEGAAEFVRSGFAAVAIAHNGFNITPMSFPLKFLKYFKLGADRQHPLSALDAAVRAFAYASNNPNPLNQFLIAPFIAMNVNSEVATAAEKVAVRQFMTSRPVIAGYWNIKGSDLDVSQFSSGAFVPMVTLDLHKTKLGLKDIIH